MATAKPKPAAAPAAPRARKWWHWLVPGALGIAVVGLVAGWGSLHQRARLVAARAAREACGCRHIDGRALGDCRQGLAPGAPTLWLVEDASGRSVTARLLPFASETATFVEGAGCQLGPWQD